MASVIRSQAGADLEFIAATGRTVNFTTDAGTVSIASLATEGFVTSQINAVIDAAPGALDTLNELAAALGDDANYSTTITNALALKANASDVTTALGLKQDAIGATWTMVGGAIVDSADSNFEVRSINNFNIEADGALNITVDAQDTVTTFGLSTSGFTFGDASVQASAAYTKAEIDADWYTATEVDTAITNNNVSFVNAGLATKAAAYVASPTTSLGVDGDLAGMVAFGGGYIYYCTANWDGTNNIWARVALTLETW